MGYFRDGGSSDTEQAPVRRFEMSVPNGDQYDDLEALIPSSPAGGGFSNGYQSGHRTG